MSKNSEKCYVSAIAPGNYVHSTWSTLTLRPLLHSTPNWRTSHATRHTPRCYSSKISCYQTPSSVRYRPLVL